MSVRQEWPLTNGVALLEALVAMAVMAVGMLGIASMLIVAHKASSSSYLKQQAMQSAYNIMDSLRANRQAALNGSYNVSNLVTSGVPSLPSAPSTNCNSSVCTTTQLAAYDIWYWLARDLTRLPNGCGAITTVAATTGNNTVVTITVQWDDSPAQRFLGANGLVSSGGNASLVQFVVETLL